MERKRSLKGLLFCFILGLFCLMPLPVLAKTGEVIDTYGMLTDSEKTALENKASEIADKYDTNVLVLYVDQDGFSSNYARDVVESYGSSNYPEGYIAYIVNMADRSYWVDAYGSRERSIFSQSDTDNLAEMAFDQLKQGDYYQSAVNVLNEIDKKFDIATSPLGAIKKLILYPGITLGIVGGSGVLSLVAALLWTGAKTAKHKDKGEKYTADEYGGNFNLNRKNDTWISHYQTRVPRPKQSSGGGHGGGGSAGHTGSGGHF